MVVGPGIFMLVSGAGMVVGEDVPVLLHPTMLRLPTPHTSSNFLVENRIQRLLQV